MTGELLNTDHGWMVSYTEDGLPKGLSLHYDDVDAMAEIWRQDHAIAKSPEISPKQACKD